MAQHARSFSVAAHADLKIRHDKNARAAYFRDEIYILIVAEVFDGRRPEEHQAFRAQKSRQMNQAAFAANVQKTVRQNVFRQLQVYAKIVAVGTFNFNVFWSADLNNLDVGKSFFHSGDIFIVIANRPRLDFWAFFLALVNVVINRNVFFELERVEFFFEVRVKRNV